jgi:histidinol-phosphate/aromatic aminotransferase/cobyric acid decarboxylase-like protein
LTEPFRLSSARAGSESTVCIFHRWSSAFRGGAAALGAFTWEAARRRDAGQDVIFLTIGDPDQAPPEPVIEATIEALRRHRTGYSATIGYPRVREAIAARFQRRTGRPCCAENVVVTPGAQGGLFCALQCLAGPGDEVIVPEPIYATYGGVIGTSGARLVTVPLRADRGFHPDLGAIASAVTPRTRVIWINSPHNPTGVVFTADEIAGVAELCRSRDLWLVSDEVYEDLAFARRHVSPWSLPDMAERTVVVSSLSKSHAMPGFRFGWTELSCDTARRRHVCAVGHPWQRARFQGFCASVVGARERRRPSLRWVRAKRGRPFADRTDRSRTRSRGGGSADRQFCPHARRSNPVKNIDRPGRAPPDWPVLSAEPAARDGAPVAPQLLQVRQDFEERFKPAISLGQ